MQYILIQGLFVWVIILMLMKRKLCCKLYSNCVAQNRFFFSFSFGTQVIFLTSLQPTLQLCPSVCQVARRLQEEVYGTINCTCQKKIFLFLFRVCLPQICKLFSNFQQNIKLFTASSNL